MADKNQCNPQFCPIPMCQLPETLDIRQIKTVMVYLDIPYKEIASEFDLNSNQVWAIFNKNVRYQKYLKPISDYMKKRLLETVKK